MESNEKRTECDSKQFDLEVILTLSTKMLLTDMKTLHEALDYLAGKPIYSSQIPSALSVASKYVLEVYPQLAEVVLEEGQIRGASSLEEFITKQKTKYGDRLPLTPMAQGIYERICESIVAVKEFNYKGYDCTVMKDPMSKVLLGYVKLPKGHKYFGVDADKIPVKCHGGLNYGKVTGDHYIIGFDCGHAFDVDFGPKRGLRNLEYPIGVPNKSENYVVKNIEGIVDQLEVS
jgi:hypothetical protein